MNTAPIFVFHRNPVIPTGIRPSAFGRPNGVEEPGVRWLRQTACVIGKSIAFVAALGIVLLWMTRMTGAQTTPASRTDAQEQLNTLTTALANGSVTSIDILHMPDGTETLASVRPENLERWWDCRITISKVREWVGRNELVEAMKSTKVASNSRMPDLRSAVIFNDSHGNRIGALYFGRYFGKYIGPFGGAEGSIGNTPVKFNGGLSTWLKHLIPSSLQ